MYIGLASCYKPKNSMYQFSIKARRGYLHLAYLIYFFSKLDQNWDSKRLWPKPNLCQFDVIFGLDGKQTNFTVPEVSKIVIKFEPLRAGFQKKRWVHFCSKPEVTSESTQKQVARFLENLHCVLKWILRRHFKPTLNATL